MFIHRLLDPVEAQLFQAAAKRQRFAARIPVERVDHQADIGTDRLAHGGAGFQVHAHIRRPTDGRHPGVQLDPPVAARDQLFGKATVILGRCQTAFQLIPAHHRSIGRDLAAIGADQLVDRLTKAAPGQIPQRAVDNSQRAVGQLRRRSALPMRQFLPQPFAVAVVLTDQHLAHELVQHMRAHHLWRGEAVALLAVFGRDGQNALLHLMRIAGMGMTRAVGMPPGGVQEDTGRDVGDNHGANP